MGIAPVFEIRQGDTQPTLSDTLHNPITGNPQDLTGSTVVFVARPTNGATVTINTAASIVYAAGGVVQYPFSGGDTATPGELRGEWRVSYPGGQVETFPLTQWSRIRIVESLTQTQTSPAPRGVVCQPWISADDVRARPHADRLNPAVLGPCAVAATEVLYARSGRQFPGLCATTVRPTMQPHERGPLAWAAFAGQYGYASQGTWSPLGLGWAGQGWGSRRWPPAVDLGVYPLVSVEQVKIDGVVIPADEYRIDDSRWLVRVRPTAGAQPTERYGWPTSQALDLPDTEAGTFSVSCQYGTAPPQMGKVAAAALAAYLATFSSPATGANLPARTTQVSRAGVTMTTADAVAALGTGHLGVPEADLWIETINPTRAQRRPAVWSPDLGTARRAGV